MSDGTQLRFLSSLLSGRLRRRQCVAFVGAGFSMACGMPSWAMLVRTLMDDATAMQVGAESEPAFDACRQSIADGNYGMAANILRDLMTPAEIDDSVRRQFGLHLLHHLPPAERARMHRRMEALARGPWAGIITTNYDELIEFALGKWATCDVVKATGLDPRLGVILASPPPGGFFFVKVHGSVSGSQLVLGADEYDRTYLGTSQMTAFLSALMLRYHVVFLGCSLEDEILRIRRKLCHDFKRLIPTSYALLQDTPHNRARRNWLRDQAQIESVVYPASDTSHRALDDLLDEVMGLSDLVSANHDGEGSQAELMKKPLDARLSEVGSLNYLILRIVYDQPSRSLAHTDVLNLGYADIASEHVDASVTGISPEERVYRVFFLAAIGLLATVRDDQGVLRYSMPPAVAEVMARRLPGIE